MDIPAIRLAHEQGLGIGVLAGAHLVGEPLEHVARDALRPERSDCMDFPNVVVHGKAGCRYCRDFLRECLGAIEDMGSLSAMKRVVHILLDAESDCDGNRECIVFGDCACRIVPDDSRGGWRIKGCPPLRSFPVFLKALGDAGGQDVIWGR